MKKVTAIVLSLFTISFTYGQKVVKESEVPAAVIKTYNVQNTLSKESDVWREYPDKYTVDWTQDSEHTYTFAYTKNGEWLNRIETLSESKLPSNVKKDLDKRFPDYKIESVLSEISNDGKFYVVTMKHATQPAATAYYLMSGEFVK